MNVERNTVESLVARIEQLEKIIESMKKQNILYGKKYVSCGDSFTQGDFSGLSDKTYCIDAQTQQFKTYPWWIANRNQMQLVNMALCGATLANVKNDEKMNFSCSRYMEIPNDADYLTLYFGINDSHQNVPIGTIEDSDNRTFCGAWNRVLEYLLLQYPRTKIGIIVSNGCDIPQYAHATVEMSRKWGIPYLDLNEDDRVPIVHRVNSKPYVCERVHTVMKERYRVTENNTHPNLLAHQMESTYIENFLRSL